LVICFNDVQFRLGFEDFLQKIIAVERSGHVILFQPTLLLVAPASRGITLQILPAMLGVRNSADMLQFTNNLGIFAFLGNTILPSRLFILLDIHLVRNLLLVCISATWLFGTKTWQNLHHCFAFLRSDLSGTSIVFASRFYSWYDADKRRKLLIEMHVRRSDRRKSLLDWSIASERRSQMFLKGLVSSAIPSCRSAEAGDP
jgi:hypothetical protein